MLDALVDILVALVKVFPDLLDALHPDHPITQRVKDLLPEESESARVARELSNQASGT